METAAETQMVEEATAAEWAESAADVELERAEVWAGTAETEARAETEVEPCRKCRDPIARKTFATTCSFRMGCCTDACFQLHCFGRRDLRTWLPWLQ